jgi:hypothetical protein
MRRALHWLAALALATAACGAAAPPVAAGEAPFERVDPGLAPMTCGRDAQGLTILEVNGGGLALFDGDDDGDLDLLLVIPGAYPERGVRSGGANRLYRNDGGRFTDVTAGSGVDVPGFCNGVAVGDFDADGRRDLFLTRLGPDALLRNAGGLRFEEVPGAAGAAGAEWSTSAVSLDVDRDGDADLFVATYLDFDPDDPPLHGRDGRNCLWNGEPVMCGPQGLPPQADRFWRNDGGRFTDATGAAGFAAPPAYGLGCIDGDWNGDGWPDVYVSNDSMPNTLYLSRGDGTVREAGLLAGAALSARGREQAGMGIAAADADGDLDEDLLVTNFSMEPNAFYVNQGGGTFLDLADPSGLGGPSRPLLGWGAAFLDADLDGDHDLLTANGHVYVQADRPGTGTRWAQPEVLYLNEGAGRFRVADWPAAVPAPGRALATGDVDDDGVPDVLVARLGQPPVLWRGTARGPTLVVRVAGRPGNPDGCGTRLLFTDGRGARSHHVRTSCGYQSAGDPRAFFAWRGPGTLEATFPDGRRATRAVDAPGRVVLEVPAP